MRVQTMVERSQKATLSSLRHVNEAVLDVVTPLFTELEPYLKVTTQLPGVGRLPTPKEAITRWFEFSEGVLKEQKEFLTKFVTLLPEPPVEPHVVKPAAKAA